MGAEVTIPGRISSAIILASAENRGGAESASFLSMSRI